MGVDDQDAAVLKGEENYQMPHVYTCDRPNRLVSAAPHANGERKDIIIHNMGGMYAECDN